MTKNTKIALLLSAAIVLGGSTLAFAHIDGPPPPDGPMQGLVHRDKLATRLLSEFDSNKDGKITKAEFNNILGTRFANATHRGSAMMEDQFLAIHQGDFQQHAAAMFRRIDWNGDGRLTLDEFSAPQKAHFQMMDREGSGTVTCRVQAMHADYRPDGDDAPPPERGWHRGGGGHGPGGFGRGRFGGRGPGGFGRTNFCNDSDISRDGKVTRAEFDAIMTKHFQSAAAGAPAITLAAFTADQQTRFRDMNDKMFKRLDKDGDGKLSLAEFAGPPLNMFARLDRNHDGVVTADEMKPRFHGRDRGGWGRGRGGDHRPPPPPGGDD